MLLMGGDRKKYVTQILGDKEGGSKEPPMHAVAKELLSYIHSGDAEGMVQCLKTLFMHFDSEPHEEGPHTEG